MNAYKMYVWTDSRWIAVAHARSVQEARDLAIEDATGILGEADWSTPVTADMLSMIRTSTPQIYYRNNAETALTSSGQLEELELYAKTLEARTQLLEAALRDVLDDTLDRNKSLIYARNILEAPLAPPHAKPRLKVTR